jgi:hypothetical protein
MRGDPVRSGPFAQFRDGHGIGFPRLANFPDGGHVIDVNAEF